MRSPKHLVNNDQIEIGVVKNARPANYLPVYIYLDAWFKVPFTCEHKSNVGPLLSSLLSSREKKYIFQQISSMSHNDVFSCLNI